MRKALLLVLALMSLVMAFVSAPRPVEAADCFWFCDCDGVHCSCGLPRSCPWPPPPIACPAC